MTLHKVASVCTARDIDVWRYTAHNLVKYIPSHEYSVIVPTCDVEIFRNESPASFTVIDEEAFLPGVRALIKSKMPVEAQSRVGWCYQPFLKLTFLESARNDEIFLIWDSDTIPLKHLSFVDERGRVVYFTGREFHAQYFETIRKLLGLEKIVNHSFIAQCFACKGAWTATFLEEIEQRHGKSWIEAILDCTNLFEGAGFSEYETLGTFVSHRYEDDIVYSRKRWNRRGGKMLGSPEKLNHWTAKFKLRPYHYVAFENWDIKN